MVRGAVRVSDSSSGILSLGEVDMVGGWMWWRDGGLGRVKVSQSLLMMVQQLSLSKVKKKSIVSRVWRCLH